MIKNQPLKYHGGKYYLAPWIHSLAPPSCIDDPKNGYTHRNIVYAGGLGEFWNWLPIDGISEAVNDKNALLTNLWEVLAYEGTFKEFQQLVATIPFSENAWHFANHTIGDVLEGEYRGVVNEAVQLFVKYRQSRQGLGTCYATPSRRTRRGMNENVSAYLSAVDGLPECHERLRRVEIRNMDALKFIEAYDHPRALFYLDPTYLHETRTSTGEYGKFEMTPAQHNELLNCLSQIEGKFMLSGYPSGMYALAEVVHYWNFHEKVIDNKASSSKSKRKQTECLWTNY